MLFIRAPLLHLIPTPPFAETLTLWLTHRWVPEILRHKRLRVVFTTEIHGYNLELLYSHCRTVAPSLLVVEAENGTVIGGFCSDPWQVKNRRFCLGGVGEGFMWVIVIG